MRSKSFLPILSAALLIAACGGEPEAAQVAAPAAEPMAMPAADTPPPAGEPIAVEGGGEYRDVTPAELQAMLEAEEMPLINVHIPFEGDLPGTDQTIAFNEIEEHLDQLPADRNAPIVLYCRSGSMSTQAAAALVRLGYTNVYNLAGGFRAWTAAGFPMADS